MGLVHTLNTCARWDGWGGVGWRREGGRAARRQAAGPTCCACAAARAHDARQQHGSGQAAAARPAGVLRRLATACLRVVGRETGGVGGGPAAHAPQGRRRGVPTGRFRVLGCRVLGFEARTCRMTFSSTSLSTCSGPRSLRSTSMLLSRVSRMSWIHRFTRPAGRGREAGSPWQAGRQPTAGSPWQAGRRAGSLRPVIVPSSQAAGGHRLLGRRSKRDPRPGPALPSPLGRPKPTELAPAVHARSVARPHQPSGPPGPPQDTPIRAASSIRRNHQPATRSHLASRRAA